MAVEQQYALQVAEAFVAAHTEHHPFKELRTQFEATTSRISAVRNDALRASALRLARCSYDAFFIGQVCSWKVFHLARALVDGLRSANLVAAATLVRSLVEHLASLVFVCDALEKLLSAIEGQNTGDKIDQALKKAEILLKRSYYGYGSKSGDANVPKAIHINDCLEVLGREVRDIVDVYAYLCEYVHPNHGSNRLVSRGELGIGDLEPDAAELLATTEKISGYGRRAIQALEEAETRLAKLCIEMNDLCTRSLSPSASLANWLAKRSSRPVGDGKSKETAYYFPTARSSGEAITMTSEFLRNQGTELTGLRHVGGVTDAYVYDVYPTASGPIWFKIPIVKMSP